MVKIKNFVAKTKDFWWKWRIFYFSSSSPEILPLCHSVCQCLPCILIRGDVYTEYVQTYQWENPLYWACADATLGMCRHTNEGKSSDLHNWQNWRHKRKLTVFTHIRRLIMIGKHRSPVKDIQTGALGCRLLLVVLVKWWRCSFCSRKFCVGLRTTTIKTRFLFQINFSCLFCCFYSLNLLGNKFFKTKIIFQWLQSSTLDDVLTRTVADPGFPRHCDANPRARNRYLLCWTFCRKLQEKKKEIRPGGGATRTVALIS